MTFDKDIVRLQFQIKEYVIFNYVFLSFAENSKMIVDIIIMDTVW